ncbi:MAG TPA: hypothetical protein DG577_05385 [Firmicutes bacterium]|jgi:hypothetical protein|nr:hypothetical protein [Bacillota bacterium]HCX78827.1 hypothetical protein [Bacillota bacterium]
MLFAFLLISVSLLPWAPVTYASGFKVLADSSGIRIISDEPVFSFDNMAPGDSAPIDLEVVNESNESYSLAISADVEEGDRPLYDKLTVIVRGEEDKYSGPLCGLQKINLGSFPAESTRSLHMTLTLPVDAGNELQELAVRLKFHLYQVQGEPPGSGGEAPPNPVVPSYPGQPEEPPADEDNPGSYADPELPVTGTQLDLLLPLGLILFLIGLLILGSAKKEQKK